MATPLSPPKTISDEKLREHIRAIEAAEKKLAEARKGLRRANRQAGIPRYRKFWTALGQFIHHFAEVERVLFLTLSHYAGTRRNVARIVFSGTRVDTANTYLRAMATGRKMSKKKRAELFRALDQLGHINKTRNDILHHGTDRLDPDRIIISNMVRAKSKDALREFEVTPQSLDHMTSDSITIAGILIAHALTGAEERTYRTQVKRFESTWRYKPPALINRDQATIGKLLTRLRRRKSVV